MDKNTMISEIEQMLKRINNLPLINRIYKIVLYIYNRQ